MRASLAGCDILPASIVHGADHTMRAGSRWKLPSPPRTSRLRGRVKIARGTPRAGS